VLFIVFFPRVKTNATFFLQVHFNFEFITDYRVHKMYNTYLSNLLRVIFGSLNFYLENKLYIVVIELIYSYENIQSYGIVTFFDVCWLFK
jgi:hypothetical protein